MALINHKLTRTSERLIGRESFGGTGFSSDEALEYFSEDYEVGTESADLISLYSEAEHDLHKLEYLDVLHDITADSPSMTAVEAYNQRITMEILVGSDISDETMPALEGFNTSSNRARSSRLALESVIEGAKKVFKKIVENFKLWVKNFLRFLNKYLSFTGQLNKSFKALAAKANDPKGKIDKGTIDISADVYNNLTLADKIVAGKDIAKGLLAINDIAKAGMTDQSLAQDAKLVTDALKEIKTDEASLADSQKINDDLLAKRNGIYTKLESTLKITTSPANDKRFSASTDAKVSVTHKKSAELLGSKAIFITKTEAEKSSEAGSLTFKYNIQLVSNTDNHKAVTKEEKVKTLDTGEITEIADAGVLLTQTLLDAKGDISDREKLFDAAADAALKLNNDLDAALSKDAKIGSVPGFTGARNLCRSINTLANTCVQPQKALREAGYSSAKAAYNYSVASLKDRKEA